MINSIISDPKSEYEEGDYVAVQQLQEKLVKHNDKFG